MTKSKNHTVNEEVAREIKRLLGSGLGNRSGQKEGKMMAEPLICCARGLPHSYDSGCASEAVMGVLGALNSSSRWTSNQTRAKGLERLVIAQLETKDTLDDVEFLKQVTTMTIKTVCANAMLCPPTNAKIQAQFT